MPHYSAAIDQGTTSTRLWSLTTAGGSCALTARARSDLPQAGLGRARPHANLGAHPPVIQGAFAKAKIARRDIAAVGVTNQRETTVVWDRRTGQPVYNAIVWQDTRTAEICAELEKEGGQDRLRAQTGLPLATYFSGPKIKWILDNVNGARVAAERDNLLSATWTPGSSGG